MPRPAAWPAKPHSSMSRMLTSSGEGIETAVRGSPGAATPSSMLPPRLAARSDGCSRQACSAMRRCCRCAACTSASRLSSAASAVPAVSRPTPRHAACASSAGVAKRASTSAPRAPPPPTWDT
eukprot:4777620-Prymnesium_polylepis.1